MANRYRYIFGGEANPNEKISSFKLYAAGIYMPAKNVRFCIRVRIPIWMELQKHKFDSYYTAYSPIYIRLLEPVILDRKTGKIDKKLTEDWLNGKAKYTDFLK